MSNVLYIIRGDSRILDLTARTPEGTPYLLSNVALRFTVKRGHEDVDADALISKSTGSGIDIVDPQAGTAEITLTPTDTAALRPFAQLVFDVQAVDGDEVATLVVGEVRVLPDVTRAVT
jgi:hypothetical protein